MHGEALCHGGHRPMKRTHQTALVLLAAASAIAGYGLRALAEGGSRTSPLFFAGTISDRGGVPLEGTHNVRVGLFNAASGGSAVCTTPALSVEFALGRFSVELPTGPTGCDTAIANEAELWSELSVDGTTFPRTQVGAVPYALEAKHALTAQGLVGEQADRLSALEARVAELEKGNSPEATLAAVNTALATPTGALRWNYRMISEAGGCTWNESNNATNCVCDADEIVIEGGGWGGPGNMLNSSRSFPPGSIPEHPSRAMTFSCVTPTGAGVHCQDVWASCVRATAAP